MPVSGQQIARESTRFTSKYETVINTKRPICIRDFSLFRKVNESRVRQCGIKCIKVCMPLKQHLRPIVQACSFDGAIVHSKSSSPYNVQRNTSRGTQSRDVTCIRRYLWLNYSDAN